MFAKPQIEKEFKIVNGYNNNNWITLEGMR